MLFILICTVSTSKAQVVFTSLDACIRYAWQHNPDVAIARQQVAIQENNLQRAWYQILPQLNAYSTLEYNFTLQTQLLPGEIFNQPKGTLIPVQFGTRYNLAAIGEASMPLVSPGKWKEVNVARVKEQYAGMELQHQQQQMEQQLTVAYYQSLLAYKSYTIAQEQQSLADSLHAVVSRRYNQGLVSPVEQQEVKQLAINALITQQEQWSVWQQRLNDLRLILQVSPADSLVIQDTLSTTGLPVSREDWKAGNVAAIKVQQLNQAVNYAQWQQRRARNLPELSAYARYGKIAQRNSFDFTAKDATWFGLGVVGLRLDIPIFAPARQKSDVKEAQLQYEMSLVAGSQTALKEEIQWNNWYEQYIRCLQSLPHARESMALATDNYHKTLLQFDSGIIGVEKAIERYKDALQAQWQAQQILIQLYQTAILLKSETADHSLSLITNANQ
ncbi:outer membrane protein TolC [Chitinophaga niastensis]|uniref:Outer membrane protein TolC n=1 Tax=Chitinophaga niastensis TaxID=536980 RepID=A0A2P8HDQ2_CHINA|nr:TolC family protein [Chitinophaga niastensis]PSL44337.1 outer membrane protein TolC [Chitinophaga niastensis]